MAVCSDSHEVVAKHDGDDDVGDEEDEVDDYCYVVCKGLQLPKTQTLNPEPRSPNLKPQ